MLRVRGGQDGEDDVMNVDDSGDASNNSGRLTATLLTGFGLGTGIDYAELEQLNLALGSGGDELVVESTAAGTMTSVHGVKGAAMLIVRRSTSTRSQAWKKIRTVAPPLWMAGLSCTGRKSFWLLGNVCCAEFAGCVPSV